MPAFVFSKPVLARIAQAVDVDAVLMGLFLLYRAIWLTSWYWPYRLLHRYLAEQLPMAAPWAINTMAMLMALLIFAQGAALLSFVLWGKHRRETLMLVLAGVVLNAGLGWYSHGRVVVDERGHVIVRVVESPTGVLKVVDREFDAETGRRARIATETDLVMLDLQRRGVKVRRVGKGGPLRISCQCDLHRVVSDFALGHSYISPVWRVGTVIPSTFPKMFVFSPLIIVSASGKENAGKENRGFVIFLSCIFLSAGLDGRNDDQGRFVDDDQGRMRNAVDGVDPVQQELHYCLGLYANLLQVKPPIFDRILNSQHLAD